MVTFKRGGGPFRALDARKETRTLAVNEAGYRVGQSHQRSILTDEDVEEIRELNDGGNRVSEASPGVLREQGDDPRNL